MSTRPSLLARLLGLVPVPVPPQVFGVDADAIHYGGFARAAGGWGLERLETAELPPDTFHSGPLGGPLRGREGFERALDGLLERSETRPTEASLVLPDRWLRLLFTPFEEELGAAPGEDVLRFKLKKLVPFRVEDLRLRAAFLPPVGGGSAAGSRLLFAFAVDQLLRDLEGMFSSRGIRIGQVASRALYLMSLLRGAELSGPSTAGGGGAVRGVLLAHLEPDGYTLAHLVSGVPFVVRYRALQGDPSDLAGSAHVTQDLRILLGFLEEQLPGHRLDAVLVCGSPAATAAWTALLRDRFSLPARPLAVADLGDPASSLGDAASFHRIAPLHAAATREVA